MLPTKMSPNLGASTSQTSDLLPNSGAPGWSKVAQLCDLAMVLATLHLIELLVWYCAYESVLPIPRRNRKIRLLLILAPWREKVATVC